MHNLLGQELGNSNTCSPADSFSSACSGDHMDGTGALKCQFDPVPVALKNDGFKFLGMGSRSTVCVNLDTQQIVKLARGQEAVEHTDHELQMFNCWAQLAGRGHEQCQQVQGGLLMPFRNGVYPKPSEVVEAVRQLFGMGLLIADPKRENFIKVQDVVLPVDFGLVFVRHPDGQVAAIASDSLKAAMVRDYVKGGWVSIPADLKPAYAAAIRAVADQCSGAVQPWRGLRLDDLIGAGLAELPQS